MPDVKMSRAEYMALPEYVEGYAAAAPYGSRFRFWVHRNPDSTPRMVTVGRSTTLYTKDAVFDFVEFVEPATQAPK